MLTGRESRYKFFWVGNDTGTGGVGLLLAEKWIDKVFDVKRYSDRVILLKIIVGESILTFISVYAPQSGLGESQKDTFYDLVQEVVSKQPDNEFLFPCGDWNGHIGKQADGFEGVHGGVGYGERNPEDVRLLEFAVANDMVVGSSFFNKRDSHLITYASGCNKSMIDYILLRKRHQKFVRDIKVIPSEEVVPQLKFLVCDLTIIKPKPVKETFTPRLKTWRLRDPDIKETYEAIFKTHLKNSF